MWLCCHPLQPRQPGDSAVPVPGPGDVLKKKTLSSKYGSRAKSASMIHTYIHACMHALHYITLHYITLHYITLHTYIYIHIYGAYIYIYMWCIYIYYGRIIDKNCVVLLAHVWLQEGKTKIWVLSLWSYINCGVNHKKLRFEQQYSQYVDIGKTMFLGAWKWSFTLQRTLW